LTEKNILVLTDTKSTDIIMLTAFGAGKQHLSQHVLEKDNHAMHAMDVMLKDVLVRTAVPVWQYIPTPYQFKIGSMFKDLLAAQKPLMEECFEEVKRNPGGKDTMLSLMMKARTNENDAALTDQEIFNELLTIRGAGKCSESLTHHCGARVELYHVPFIRYEY
jgi:cytochrome P450